MRRHAGHTTFLIISLTLPACTVTVHDPDHLLGSFTSPKYPLPDEASTIDSQSSSVLGHSIRAIYTFTYSICVGPCSAPKSESRDNTIYVGKSGTVYTYLKADSGFEQRLGKHYSIIDNTNQSVDVVNFIKSNILILREYYSNTGLTVETTFTVNNDTCIINKRNYTHSNWNIPINITYQRCGVSSGHIS
jgi:hypothetical protein